MSCEHSHKLPNNWKQAADDHGRIGWVTVRCRHCNGLIGHRPAEIKQSKQLLTDTEEKSREDQELYDDTLL